VCVCAGKKYVMVHAGIAGFSGERALETYSRMDFIAQRADYTKRYYDDADTFLVTGHTPTFKITNNRDYRIYEANGHIALDCGCVYGGRLAAYCLDTGKAVYVERM